MTCRNKVIALSLLCILYFLFSTLDYIRASRSTIVQDDNVIIEFDRHRWRNAVDDFPAQVPIELPDKEPAYEQPQDEQEEIEAIETVAQHRDQLQQQQQQQQPASDEKYLTFFTHSGFQNQLIQGKIKLLVSIWFHFFLFWLTILITCS